MANAQATHLRSISTDQVAPRDRGAFWREQICDVFVELDCETLAESFSGAIRDHKMGALQLSQVVASPHAVTRSKRQLARTNDDCLLVSLQMSGSCLVEQDGRSARLGPGDMAMYDSTRCYQLHFSGGFEQLVLKIPRATFSDYVAASEHVTATLVPGAVGMGRVAHQLVSSVAGQLEFLKGHELDRLAVNVTDVLGAAFGSVLNDKQAGVSTTQSALLLRVKTFVADNLRDPELSRETIAAANGISVRYLNKLFEGEDTTLSHWVREQRLANIARDLTAPQFQGRTIAEIAFAWGMNCLPHFSRVFKTHFGVTPKTYRNNALR